MKIIGLFVLIFVSFAGPNSLEVEADNPLLVCERMKIESDKKDCEAKANQENLDWYAATMCGTLKDDQKILKCWGEIEGHKVSPVSLKDCEKKSKSDDALFACVTGLKNRSPASLAPVYQKK